MRLVYYFCVFSLFYWRINVELSIYSALKRGGVWSSVVENSQNWAVLGLCPFGMGAWLSP